MSVRSYNAVEVVADLYSRNNSPAEFEILMGVNALGDTIPTVWYFDPASTATDDWSGNPLTSLVIKPTAMGTGDPGRWLRKWVMANTTGNNTQCILGDGTLGALPSTTRTTSSQTLSLVGTGATGTQISATKASTVRFTVSTSTTSTIGGPATSVVLLKKCATNSITEGDWTTVASVESNQTITLAIALQSVQVVRGQVSCDLDAGWFVKLVNSGTGTHSESFLYGEKTIHG